MRVLIIVLLLALTPLRAWAADSMAVQMATQGLGPSDAQASAVRAAEPVVHCSGMAEHHAETSPEAEEENKSFEGGPCHNCAACQMCATVALIAPPTAGVAGLQVHRLPWASVPSFSSAVLAPSQKPPIS